MACFLTQASFCEPNNVPRAEINSSQMKMTNKESCFKYFMNWFFMKARYKQLINGPWSQVKQMTILILDYPVHCKIPESTIVFVVNLTVLNYWITPTQIHNDPDCGPSPYTCTRSVSLFLPWEGEIRLQNFMVTFKGQRYWIFPLYSTCCASLLSWKSGI